MFIEQVAARGRSNKLWIDSVTGKGHVSASAGSYHFEGLLDSGIFQTERNMTLMPVNNSEINGVEIVTNSYHFRIQTEPRTGQQPDIGSFGFGGRQGQHWIYQRPTNLGYAHRPTESIDNLLSLNYNPANVSITQQQQAVGPASVSQVLTTGATLVWIDVLQFSNGGSGDIILRISATTVEADIRINQLGRDWIAANPHNVAWTDADTFLGFIADIDYTDIPRRLMRNILVGNNDDIWDDGDPLILENDAQQLLGLLPSTNVYVVGRGGAASIQKRFHRQGNQHRIVFGCTVADYLNLGPGDIIFDPPITETTVAADDGYLNTYDTWYGDYGGDLVVGQYNASLGMSPHFTFRTVTGPDADATIDTDTATLTFQRSSGSGTGINFNVECDIGTSRQTVVSDTHNLSTGNWSSGTSTAATVNGSAAGGGSKVTSAFDATLVDLFANANGGWVSGDDLCIACDEQETSVGDVLLFEQGGGTNPPQLDFTYNNPAGGGGSTMNQIQNSNLGSDLYNGTLQ